MTIDERRSELGERHRRVLDGLLCGCSDDELCERLGLSQDELDASRRAILQTFASSSQSEVIAREARDSLEELEGDLAAYRVVLERFLTRLRELSDQADILLDGGLRGIQERTTERKQAFGWKTTGAISVLCAGIAVAVFVGNQPEGRWPLVRGRLAWGEEASAVVAPELTPATDWLEIQPDADASVMSHVGTRAVGNENFGHAPDLLVKTQRDEAFRKRSVLRFRLDEFEGAVATAELWLWPLHFDRMPQQELFLLRSPWEEDQITWIDKPPRDQMLVRFRPREVHDWVRLDVTQAVRAAIAAGYDDISFVLVALEPNHLVRYASREYDEESRRPRLYLDLEGPAQATARIEGTLGFSTPMVTASRSRD